LVAQEEAQKGCVPVAIVWQTPLGVEQYVVSGRDLQVPRFACPGCKKPMNYWGWYDRYLRLGRSHVLLLRRQRCRGCASSHAVLPSFMVHGRLDAVGVIGAALQAVAGRGGAMAGAARAADVPYTTLRGWRRRFSERAELVTVGFVRAAVALGGLAPRLSENPELAAIGAVRAAWNAAQRRWGTAVGALWRFANAMVGGHLLSTNIDPPWSTA